MNVTSKNSNSDYDNSLRKVVKLFANSRDPVFADYPFGGLHTKLGLRCRNILDKQRRLDCNNARGYKTFLHY